MRPAMTPVSPEITQRLADERRQREARLRSWMLLADALAHIKPTDIYLESNPLDLGNGAPSYLEQIQIHFPEVQPGFGEIMLRTFQMLPGLIDHIQRDMMSDAERIAIGWPDIVPPRK